MNLQCYKELLDKIKKYRHLFEISHLLVIWYFNLTFQNASFTTTNLLNKQMVLLM